MKFNYKKIASILASAVMLSSTVGFAAAATSYPAPFVQSGALQGAIVYGSASAASIDLANAADLRADLNSKITVQAAATEVSGGESYLLQKSDNTKFYLGYGVRDAISSSGALDKNQLPTMLADGSYLNSNNVKSTYTQKLTVSNMTYSLFENSDYKAYTPALGMVVNTDTNIMNYTLDFDSSYPAWSTLASTDIEILGKTYFISSVTANTTLLLLDSAQRDTLSESDVKTMTVGSKSYTVKINALSGTASTPKVRLEVNGELTNRLGEGDTQQLTDGTYVGVRTVSMRDVAGTTGNVEFSIGVGQIKIVNNTEVKLNDKTVNNLYGYTDVDSSGNLQKIRLIWKKADRTGFVADGSSLTLPAFEAVKLSYGGLKTPSTADTIVIKDNGDDRIDLTAPIKDGEVTLPLLYGDTSTSLFTGIGQSSSHKLKTSSTTSVVFNASSGADDQMVVSYGNGKDYESYVLRATSFEQIGETTKTNKTNIEKKVNGEWQPVKTVQEGDEITNLGNVILTVGPIKHLDRTVNLTRGSSNVNFNTLYTKGGMKIWLPVDTNSSTAVNAIDFDQQAGDTAGLGHNATMYTLVLTEQNKDLDIGAGKNLTANLSWSSQRVTVSAVGGGSVSNIQTGDGTKVWRNYLYSPLVTMYEWDKTGDQYFLTVKYNGDDSPGQFYISAASASLGGGTQIKTFLDSDQANFKDLNLIVVGGSCVNTVALKLIDAAASQPICGEAFTAKTGVKANQYIIKTFTSPFNSAKVATLVAGYNEADTKNALARFKSGAVATDVGVSDIGPALAN